MSGWSLSNFFFVVFYECLLGVRLLLLTLLFKESVYLPPLFSDADDPLLNPCTELFF